MSTIVASNISDGTDTVGTEYVVNGPAKAWVNFNGTGTIAIRDSLNVSSLTDSGTGDYDVNVTSAMAAGDYSVSSSLQIASAVACVRVPNIASSEWRMLCSNSTVLIDADPVTSAVFGDLA